MLLLSLLIPVLLNLWLRNVIDKSVHQNVDTFSYVNKRAVEVARNGFEAKSFSTALFLSLHYLSLGFSFIFFHL